ncbi:MAG: 2OG-Fe(II) oxygenase [Acidobacteria bacterium]|nr:2OG-Fe(II) oxygenase [Acidobacteriota bacterium]
MTIRERLARLDWKTIATSLHDRGFATLPRLLTATECRGLVQLYGNEDRFRKRIEMERHRFGVGDYKYFDYPLPAPVRDLRAEAYRRLAPIVNRWMTRLGSSQRYPLSLGPFLRRCHHRGQARPTPLMLHYEAGGYNRLHQDLYGAIVFPVQLAVLLSRPATDFTGGEILLVENHPRAQSIGHAIALDQGEAVIFTTRERPVAGTRGFYRASVRHGVSRILSGSRYTLGIIFHDAK